MNRYACAPIDSIWTLEAQYARWLTVWSAASAATGHPFSIWQTDDLSWWVESSLEREGEYGHDVAAAVEVMREWLAARKRDDAARWLHYGLCSSDVVDAGWLLAMWKVTIKLTSLAGDVCNALNRLGMDSTRAVYRTHGRAAQVGNERARWRGHAHALQDAVVRVGGKRPLRIGFDGPTGTGGELTTEQREAIASRLGLAVRVSGEGRQAADREQWVTWLQAVGRIATVLERFATDIRLLAHDGVGEVSEGHGPDYRGSSSMPHKTNPTRSERLCGIAPVVRGMVNGYAEAASSIWGSHSLEHSSAERIVIPQVTSLVGFMLTEAAAIASELVVEDALVRWNVEAAPKDSYELRNQLIREGVDGGEAYEQARYNPAGRES